MLLLFSFGPAMLTFTYLYSFIFGKAMNAQTFIILFQSLSMIVIFAIYTGVASVAGVPGLLVQLLEYTGSIHCLVILFFLSLSLFFLSLCLFPLS
jgi:hypothetical protein